MALLLSDAIKNPLVLKNGNAIKQTLTDRSRMAHVVLKAVGYALFLALVNILAVRFPNPLFCIFGKDFPPILSEIS